VDVRIIAATNRDLQKEMEAGNFREDLYYRISVFQIQLPPLRDRVEDIELLAKYFMTRFANKSNKKIYHISPAYLHELRQHNWKGNIRELKNVIERSVILTDGDTLTSDTLPLEFQQQSMTGMPVSTPRALSAFDLASAEKLQIQKVLNYTNGNKTEAARLLNIALTTLYRKLSEYNIH
jgi:transcriptional regulator with PAS, ATPase and Fis domain